MENKRKNKVKRIIYTILGILIGIPVVVFILVNIFVDSPKEPIVEKESPKEIKIKVTRANWDTLNYEAKQQWIQNILTNTNDVNFEIKMMHLVKNKFKYPEEVDFNLGETPLLRNGDITYVPDGVVFFHGGGTCKNAFGVKSKFTYSIRTFFRPDSTIIDDVSVNIPQ